MGGGTSRPSASSPSPAPSLVATQFAATVFAQADIDGNGHLSLSELQQAALLHREALGEWSEEELTQAIERYDLDGDGALDCAEFTAALHAVCGGTEEWQPTPEPSCTADGAPKQLLRAASPSFMRWLLSKLGSLGAKTKTLTTHDAVHGHGSRWDAQRYAKTGFGYGPPTSPGSIRAMTAAGRTSLYYYLVQHPAAHELREELAAAFGSSWQTVCFGRATHMLSHSWGMPFAGFISALDGLPEGCFVWNDIIAINQHGDAGPLARAAMAEDLASLQPVIEHASRVILYFDPLDRPAPLTRVWCLFELLTLIRSGGTLLLGFTKEGRKELLKIASAYAGIKGTGAGGSELKSRAATLVRTLQAIDSRKATATVPADEARIKRQIVDELGGHERFDNYLREALASTFRAFVSTAVVASSVNALNAAKTPKALKAAVDEFVQALGYDPVFLKQKHGLADDIELKVKALELGAHQSDAPGLFELLPSIVARSPALENIRGLGKLEGKSKGLSIHQLKGVDPVTELRFSKLNHVGAAVVWKCIANNRHLTSLSLRNTCVTGAGTVDEFKVSTSGKMLQVGAVVDGRTVFARRRAHGSSWYLHLHYPAVMQQLAEILPKSNLKILDLLGTELTLEEAKSIMAAAGSSIQSFCGGIIAAGATECDLSAAKLPLPFNRLTSSMSMSCADALFLSVDLRRADTLTKVTVDDQLLTLAALRYLAEGLAALPGLKELSLLRHDFRRPSDDEPDSAKADAEAGIQALAALAGGQRGCLCTLTMSINEPSRYLDEAPPSTYGLHVLLEALARPESTVTTLGLAGEPLWPAPKLEEVGHHRHVAAERRGDTDRESEGCGQLLPMLAKLSKLTALDLSCTKLRTASVAEVVELLTANPALRYLQLSRNKAMFCDRWARGRVRIHDKRPFKDPLAPFWEWIAKSKLDTLALAHCGLGSFDIQQLAGAIAAGSTVTELDLSNNDLVDDGLNELCQLLERCSSLESFTMRSVGNPYKPEKLFPTEGLAVALASAKLVSLRMGGNPLDEAACKVLAATLASHESLREVEVNLHKKAARDMALVLEKNEILTDVTFCRVRSKGPFDAETKKVLEAAAGSRIALSFVH